VSIELGGKADVTITSKSAMSAGFEKSAALSAASLSLEAAQEGKIYIGNGITNLCTVLSGMIDQIAALAVTGAAAVDPAWTAAMLAQKVQVQALLNAAKDAEGG
jgi:hypothetical protein